MSAAKEVSIDTAGTKSKEQHWRLFFVEISMRSVPALSKQFPTKTSQMFLCNKASAADRLLNLLLQITDFNLFQLAAVSRRTPSPILRYLLKSVIRHHVRFLKSISNRTVVLSFIEGDRNVSSNANCWNIYSSSGFGSRCTCRLLQT